MPENEGKGISRNWFRRLGMSRNDRHRLLLAAGVSQPVHNHPADTFAGDGDGIVWVTRWTMLLMQAFCEAARKEHENLPKARARFYCGVVMNWLTIDTGQGGLGIDDTIFRLAIVIGASVEGGAHA